VYVAPTDLSGDTITTSLQALLTTRHHSIIRHRFTVLDTFDGRVRRSGACLTCDGEGGRPRLVWQSQGGGSQLVMRLKQPVSFAWDFPDGPLQKLLASVIGPRRLLAQADAEESGSLLDILDNRAKTVARLRIMSGQAKLPTATAAWQSLPTLVTLTGLRGYEEAFTRLAAVIESRPGFQSCQEGPLGVMLTRVGAPIRGDLSVPRVDLDSTIPAGIGARQIHLALLAILEANEPGLRGNLDTEFLHDFRVAVRRTRSLLSQIRGVFPEDEVQHFSAEFSWLGRLTGPPRDMDVLALSLRQPQNERPADDHEALMSALGHVQRQEHDRLALALDSDRYRTLLADWTSFLRRPSPSRPDAENADAPLRAVVSRRAWRLSRRIANNSETVDERTPPEQIHALRIDAKKLRYLIDVTPAFYDAADLACVLNALKKLQRALGDFHDADVQERRLVECGRALGAETSANVQMMLGRLAEQSRQRRESLRREVLGRLKRFRARDIRSACRHAFKSAQPEERAR